MATIKVAPDKIRFTDSSSNTADLKIDASGAFDFNKGIVAAEGIFTASVDVDPSGSFSLETNYADVSCTRLMLDDDQGTETCAYIKAPATVTPYDLTFPAAQAGISDYLINNGSGVLSWSYGVPPGMIFPYVSTSSPTGFRYCNGDAISRTDFADLFAVIGTAFGNGNGSTTFNVPDLRGKFLRGVDAGSGYDPDRDSRTALNGGNAGNNVGSYQAHMVASHYHQEGGDEHRTGTQQCDGTSFLEGQVTVNTGYGFDNRTTGSTGGNETRPKNISVTYIIKL